MICTVQYRGSEWNQPLSITFQNVVISVLPFSSRLTLCQEVVITGTMVLLMCSGPQPREYNCRGAAWRPHLNRFLCLLLLATNSFLRHAHAFIGFSAASEIWVLALPLIREVIPGPGSKGISPSSECILCILKPWLRKNGLRLRII